MGAADAAARLRATPETPAPAGRILRPGANCWRVDPADRFYCIQDAADYFRLVRQALLAARKTVFTLGWDTTAHTDLLPRPPKPDEGEGGPGPPKRGERKGGQRRSGRGAREDEPSRLDNLPQHPGDEPLGENSRGEREEENLSADDLLDAISDTSVGRVPRSPWIDRHALHAERLGFAHPMSHEWIDYHAPLPADMRRAIEALRATAAG